MTGWRDLSDDELSARLLHRAGGVVDPERVVGEMVGQRDDPDVAGAIDEWLEENGGA